MTNAIAKVAANALKHFAAILHPEAVRIFTPFTDSVPLGSCKLRTDLKHLVKPDNETAYGGTVKFGKRKIGWSVCFADGQDKAMKEHATSDEFKSARIRIATLAFQTK